jgi:anti-sigma B factor antagonist
VAPADWSDLVKEHVTPAVSHISLLDWRDMEPPELQVRATHTGGQWIVTVAGELDLCSAPDLEARLAPLVRRPGLVTLHLGQVSFLDLTAFKSLLRMKFLAHRHGSSLTIGAASPAVRRILNLTGLGEAFAPCHAQDHAHDEARTRI